MHTTDRELILQQTIHFVKKTLADAEAGHDWLHIERVYHNAKQIAEKEDVDWFTVQLATLLHDIADSKFHHGDESIGPNVALNFLKTLPIENEIIEHVIQIIKHISFKNSFDKNMVPFHSKELAVVRDADRLDAIGAIGIARAFHYGGYKNRPLYDPNSKPNMNLDKETYKNATSPTINHFYEKLLLLKDLMHTDTARKMAEERHQAMLQFLDAFIKETHLNSESY